MRAQLCQRWILDAMFFRLDVVLRLCVADQVKFHLVSRRFRLAYGSRRFVVGGNKLYGIGDHILAVGSPSRNSHPALLTGQEGILTE